MALPTTAELVAALDHKPLTELGVALKRLIDVHGLEPLVPEFMAVYPQLRVAAARNAVLFSLVRFARTYPGVVELACSALHDAATMPRIQATAILAYSLRKDALPHLTPLLQHRDRKTREAAAAAIDAIEHQNHHYWLDRKHTGNMFWSVGVADRSTAVRL